jgi:hypothetical protein
LSPAICFARVIAASTPSTNVVVGHFFGGIRRRAMRDDDDECVDRVLVVPTIGDVEQVPAAMSAPVFSVRSRNNSALASSTLNKTFSLGFGTVTSPASYHSNSSPTWSSGSAMYPSSDIVMWLKTLPIVGLPSLSKGPALAAPYFPYEANSPDSTADQL